MENTKITTITKRITKVYRPKIQKENSSKVQISNSKPIEQPQSSVGEKLSQPTKNNTKQRRTGSQNATNSPSTKVMSNGATTGIRASLASVQNSIISALADLSNAKTPEEKASLERRLSELRVQEAKLQYELEEAKKAELNQTNTINRPRPR